MSMIEIAQIVYFILGLLFIITVIISFPFFLREERKGIFHSKLMASVLIPMVINLLGLIIIKS